MPETEQDKLAVVDKLVEAFNKPDFAALEEILAEDIVFSHKNKGMEGSGREQLLSNIKMMNDAFPGRTITATKRGAVTGDVVFREAEWGGTAAVDVPGFANAGEQAHLDTMTIFVIRGGRIHEWSDFG
ncbi:nuclear transport factor 2 family protein [Amycolatopsis acidicola]|uniref:Nuclear transport factor 2 family protein n=1 Tax=Amycolatopsis acidicola TaxID=2596893 RepID=A0A5N0UYW5_9PSEU|nr:nuclear transport factor 2 family protein [Amycolatopsis acidicola]KAA9156338.1 nuclear transport factor 2 family protein [Amycolatopsis acidicola]